jgi:hypothetical protein
MFGVEAISGGVTVGNFVPFWLADYHRFIVGGGAGVFSHVPTVAGNRGPGQGAAGSAAAGRYGGAPGPLYPPTPHHHGGRQGRIQGIGVAPDRSCKSLLPLGSLGVNRHLGRILLYLALYTNLHPSNLQRAELGRLRNGMVGTLANGGVQYRGLLAGASYHHPYHPLLTLLPLPEP